MLSVASSPIVILPPIVTSPLTSKFPVMSTLSSRINYTACTSTLIAPAVLDIVFPESLRFPVSILSPFINVFCPLVVNVAPFVGIGMFKSLATKFTVPSAWVNGNKSPTLKSPLGSTGILSYLSII